MSFIDDFHDNIELLPNILQKKYALLRDLDRSLQEILRQNEQRCDQEIDDIKQGMKAGNITPDPSLIRFSDDALDEQKHSIRIADEKVALAIQSYDLVDAHIQQLDQYLRNSEEELRRERDIASATGLSDPNADNAKSGSSRGGRKKTSLAASATVSAAATALSNPTSMDLDLPVDPNEPTYCFCNQVSYGEMVACDNPDCRIEWFHFGCVGLKEKPKGKWKNIIDRCMKLSATLDLDDHAVVFFKGRLDFLQYPVYLVFALIQSQPQVPCIMFNFPLCQTKVFSKHLRGQL
ncbi:hypothetical protein Nepgr_010103 [Nepenthes gracilis]|uniref:Inhibitor of growth protein n=1 Tax=Nepenthes gracilis TaxID=150966 RepID=A0AAD3XKR2_NEPGR|nr:hypothetical protein Nepgr_010103 [Nepenthes gracilis]